MQLVSELNNKALKVGVSDAEEMYFRELIAQEKQERRPGYESRIKQIESQVDKYRLLKKTTDGKIPSV